MTLSTNELIQEIYGRMDYKADLEARMDIIEKINEDFGDLLQYYMAYYKHSNLKIYSNRTYYDKLCNVLDKLSEYMLFAPVPPEVAENLNYKKSDIPYSQESNLKSMQAHNEISFESYIHSMGDTEGMPLKKYDDQNHATYTIEHFAEHMKACPYIHDYVRYNTIARKIIQDLNRQIDELEGKGISVNSDTILTYKKSNGDKRIYTVRELNALKRGIGYSKNNSKEIDQEIVTILREYFKPIYFNQVDSPIERRRKLDIDLMDTEHMTGMIRTSCLTGWFEPFDRLVERLDKLFKKANLTNMERKVYDVFRNGYGEELTFDDFERNMVNLTDCGEMLGISKQRVSQLINSMAKKLSDEYEKEFEDYYYTYLAKGTYKQCGKCGKIKLATERYFSPNEYGKDGLRSICKECRRN